MAWVSVGKPVPFTNNCSGGSGMGSDFLAWPLGQKPPKPTCPKLGWDWAHSKAWLGSGPGHRFWHVASMGLGLGSEFWGH